MDHGEKIKNGRVLGKQKAQVFAEGLRPLIRGLMLERVRGPKAISEELNKRGIHTRTGGKWRRETVHRLIQRLEPSLSKEVKEARMEGSKKALKLMEQFRQNSA